MTRQAVTVVVPVWNRRELLERLMAALARQTCPPEEIVVVDNGSTDGAPEAAEKIGARTIRMGANAGFARAANRGIAEARTPWVALVNNDVEPACDWLQKLNDAASDSRAWFVTGKLLQESNPDRLDGTWDAISRAACAWRVGHGHLDTPEFSDTQKILFASATATLYRRELFARIGPFDVRFESYLEDVDLGLRCALAGLEGIYVPHAVALHRGSATLGNWHPRIVRLIARNQVLLIAKHYSNRNILHWFWPILAGQALWGCLAVRHGAGLDFVRGKWEGCDSSARFEVRYRPVWSPLWARANVRFTAHKAGRDSTLTGAGIFYWLALGQSDTCRMLESSSLHISPAMRSAIVWRPRRARARRS